MLRNHLFALMNAFPNHTVGALINGVLVPVDGVWESADPPGIALILDPDFLTRAMKAESPDQPPTNADQPGPDDFGASSAGE